MNDVDMFGVALPEPSKAKRKPTPKRGYAAPPGTGPDGETCGTCAHRVKRQWGGTYQKCALMQARWTQGPGSDILVRSPACKRWEANVISTARGEEEAKP